MEITSDFMERIARMEESLSNLKDVVHKIDSKLEISSTTMIDLLLRLKSIEEWKVKAEEEKVEDKKSKENSKGWWGSIWAKVIGGLLLLGMGAFVEWIRYLPPPTR